LFGIIFDYISSFVGDNYELFSSLDTNEIKSFICFDKATGIVLFSNISIPVESDIFDEVEYESFMTMEVKKFEETADENKLKLPVSFMIYMGVCYIEDGAVAIQVLDDYEGKPKINFFESVYYGEYDNIFSSIELKEYDLKQLENHIFKFTIPESLTSTSLTYEFCLGDECIKKRCYNSISTKDSYSCMLNSFDENKCNSDNKCYYDEPICKKFSCSYIIDEDECELNEGCEWSYNYCRTDYSYNNDYENSLTEKKIVGSGNLLTVSRLENGTVYIKNTGNNDVTVTQVAIRSSGNDMCTPMTTPFVIGAYSLSETRVAGCGDNLTLGNTYTVLIITESGDIYDPLAILR
jgi:hypothetical protein